MLSTLDLIYDDTPMRDVRSLVGMMLEELQAAMLILLCQIELFRWAIKLLLNRDEIHLVRDHFSLQIQPLSCQCMGV